MGISPLHLMELVIRPTLQALEMYSISAEELMLGTAAQESKLGYYLKQIGGGPALGIFQMEPWVHDDVWDNYLKYKKDIASKVSALAGRLGPKEMIHNLNYATAMTRVNYYRHPEKLSYPGDISGHARYWKKYHNTTKGKGTVEEYIKNYRDLVGFGD